jgi:polyhydroxyalkanoate synthesis regulator phasin
MEKTRVKLVVAVAAGLSLAVAVGASGAVAVSRALDGSKSSQAVIDEAAEELGVEPSALSDALRNALKNRVDEAIEAGRLTEEQGARLKERIDSGEMPLLGLGHRGPGKGMGRLGHFHFGRLDAAARYLELSREELREQLAGGKTLAEIATAEGKSVDGLVDALVASAEKKIDTAVTAGRLTEERAAELKADLRSRITALVDRELRPRGLGHRFGRGPGHGSFHGPPAFRGSRA